MTFFRSSPALSMIMRKLCAEFLGTFTLAYLVLLSSITSFPTIFTTPFIAALTVGLFVYMIGPLSGAQLNPAVSIALLSLKKMTAREAVLFIVAQCAGTVIALLLIHFSVQGPENSLEFISKAAVVPDQSFLRAVLGEALGAFFLLFGIVSVVLKRVPDGASGVVIGISLFVGIIIASSLSLGILNPAVALVFLVFRLPYFLGPIIGGIAGAWAASWIHGK